MNVFVTSYLEKAKMNEQLRGVDGALAAIEELRIDSKLGKSKHFNASERKLRYHWLFGVPVIVANLLVGVVLVGFQKMSADPRQAIDGAALASSAIAAKAPLAASYIGGSWITVASILLAFGAALFSAIQTLFNFHKSSEGHRSIGNRYVHVSRQCKELQQRHRDIPFTPEELWEKYHALASPSLPRTPPNRMRVDSTQSAPSPAKSNYLEFLR
ncbi:MULTISPECIES: SLATT domain-containing protein [Paraburkholderia]|uniref:SLATT domain-containing protein n=1 Tax=Paraburkholderia TaxID=1822464 RepID=UPI0022588B56|nr:MULTISPECIES: SLATT domain-containing protein [Paraburkholderia]MCX4152651.1 SLATT domain-containing protein [Paraburkholderia aspalathi]MDN7162066.1 SLATT domain-containing protein [Paraburkholderia sp. SECH2]MDQ6390552.1 SLATT domain-containing protein [Paraburkholderia aspalathi]